MSHASGEAIDKEAGEWSTDRFVLPPEGVKGAGRILEVEFLDQLAQPCALGPTQHLERLTGKPHNPHEIRTLFGPLLPQGPPQALEFQKGRRICPNQVEHFYRATKRVPVSVSDAGPIPQDQHAATCGEHAAANRTIL